MLYVSGGLSPHRPGPDHSTPVMKTVNIEGLPEPIAAAVVKTVETLRSQFVAQSGPRPPIDLPSWPGKVLGNLTREEIYEHAE
jgi:hypothetical protein